MRSSPAVHVVAVANHKGGVGKTSLAVSLAAAWAGEGGRALLVDLDGQASASAWLGAADDGADRMLATFADGAPLYVTGSTVHGLDVAPASPALARLDAALSGQPDAVTALRPALASVAHVYTWAVLDTPARFGLATPPRSPRRPSSSCPSSRRYSPLGSLAALATIDRVRARLAPTLPPAIIAPVPGRRANRPRPRCRRRTAAAVRGRRRGRHAARVRPHAGSARRPCADRRLRSDEPGRGRRRALAREIAGRVTGMTTTGAGAAKRRRGFAGQVDALLDAGAGDAASDVPDVGNAPHPPPSRRARPMLPRPPRRPSARRRRAAPEARGRNRDAGQFR
ncbi:MAG: ParA family protein [Dehalococcoidia bacterium]